MPSDSYVPSVPAGNMRRRFSERSLHSEPSEHRRGAEAQSALPASRGTVTEICRVSLSSTPGISLALSLVFASAVSIAGIPWRAKPLSPRTIWRHLIGMKPRPLEHNPRHFYGSTRALPLPNNAARLWGGPFDHRVFFAPIHR
jgi:hypothetical protein